MLEVALVLSVAALRLAEIAEFSGNLPQIVTMYLIILSNPYSAQSSRGLKPIYNLQVFYRLNTDRFVLQAFPPKSLRV
jgi:hypothetical protein